MEETPKSPSTTSRQELFAKWIPGIYVSNIDDVPRLKSLLYSAANETLLETKELMRKHNLKGGGFFLQINGPNIILLYYSWLWVKV